MMLIKLLDLQKLNYMGHPKQETSPATIKAREYCKKFKDTGSRPLARKLYNENKELYKNENSACSYVRRIRGANGKRNRGQMLDKSLYKDIKGSSDNQIYLPESRINASGVFRMPTSVKKVLLLGDIHLPYHDIEAIEGAVKYGQKEGVDCVFINGDLIDFYQLSFHEKDPRKRSVKGELDDCKQFFGWLRGKFPKALIYWIPGNHEIRLERYLKVKAAELLDVEEFRLDVLTSVREYGINFIKYGTKCYFGKLMVEHGDKMKGSGGVNPARTLFLRLKRHAICGHFHRTTENSAKVYDGDVVVTYSVGALCDLEPDYLPINEHNHGCAIIELDGKGGFSVQNKKIVNGNVY